MQNVILPHKLSSNLEGSGGLFYELWSSVFSIDFQLDSSRVIDWAILAALFSFSETNWEFFLAVCLGSLSCWNVHPRFIFSILVDRSRFLSRMSRYISPFILPSIIWSRPVPYAEKQPPHHDVPTSKLHCWYSVFGMMCGAISPPKHGVCYDIQSVQFFFHLARLYSPSIS